MPKILKVATLVVALAGTWLPCVADAQNRLPPCPSDRPVEEWTNCYGTSADAKGNLYEGDFKDGKRHGRGVGTFIDDTIYTGEFKDDSLTGKGVATYASGDKYVGEFKNGLRNAFGTYTHANGNVYVGQYKDGKRNGKGTLLRARSGQRR
jgi:hypothetical protein